MKQCFSIDEQFILISIKIFKFNNSSQWCIFFPLYICAHKANDICINTYNLNRYNSSYTLLLLFLFLWKWTCSYVLAGKKNSCCLSHFHSFQHEFLFIKINIFSISYYYYYYQDDLDSGFFLVLIFDFQFLDYQNCSFI